MHDHDRLRLLTFIGPVEKPTLFSKSGRVTCAMEYPNDDELFFAHLLVNGVGMMKRHSQPNTELFPCCFDER